MTNPTKFPHRDASLAPRKSHAVAAFVLWAVAVLVFVVAAVVGVSIDRAAYARSTPYPVYSVASFLLPAFSLVACVPLLMASVIVSAVAIRAQRRRGLAITTVVLAVLCLVPAGCLLVLLVTLWVR